jgi:hypothetical protein
MLSEIQFNSKFKLEATEQTEIESDGQTTRAKLQFRGNAGLHEMNTLKRHKTPVQQIQTAAGVMNYVQS